jgi:hypothetical protein
MGNARDDSKAIVLLPLEAKSEPARDLGVTWLVVLLTLASAAVLVFPLPLWMRLVAVAAVLGVALLVSFVRRSRPRSPSRPLSRPLSRPPARGSLRARGASIAIDARGIFRLGGDNETATIARWDEPFGLTLLANPSRTRAVFAFTSAERTRLVPIGGAESDSRWLERAVTVTDADLDDALHGPSHGFLSGRSGARLFTEVETRAAAAIDRLYLFDASGAKVVLEGDKLGAHDKVIDLAEPVEWRSFTFHEAGVMMSAPGGATEAAAVVVYQATWIRQGTTELVLVCPIPADASSLGLGRSSNHPPARENRVAVDRLFMLPLRKAVEGAPRIARAGAPPRRSSHAIPT